MSEFHFGADNGVISVTISTVRVSGDSGTFQVLSSCHYEIQLVSLSGSRMHPCNLRRLSEEMNVSVMHRLWNVISSRRR